MTNSYDDIINLPRHVSSTRPQMAVANRAAQFSPFAALTGYEAAIQETARITDERKDFSDGIVDDLDMKLCMLQGMIDERPEITITYFQSDKNKAGGEYVTAAGKLKKIDDYEHVLTLVSGKKIPISDIMDIECELLKFKE